MKRFTRGLKPRSARGRKGAARPRNNARRRPAPKSVKPAQQQALALKRYICLLLGLNRVAHMQLTLRDGLPPSAIDWLVALLRRAGIQAFPASGATVLVAAGPDVARAFAHCAAERGVLGRKLKARLRADAKLSPTVQTGTGQTAFLKRALIAVTELELPRPRAFADAGLDLSRIYSSRRSR